VFVREHRLYQVDFLIRKYRFGEGDIIFGRDGNLSLEVDPKQVWADAHPERFPVNVNRAGKFELLRVPGFGPVTAGRILERRRDGRLSGMEDIGRMVGRLAKASRYVVF
jgi:predicted DNA-binding helix-hairpin-helix protein